jgi:hypothetical protein
VTSESIRKGTNNLGNRTIEEEVKVTRQKNSRGEDSTRWRIQLWKQKNSKRALNPERGRSNPGQPKPETLKNKKVMRVVIACDG